MIPEKGQEQKHSASYPNPSSRVQTSGSLLDEKDKCFDLHWGRRSH
jgi:hypothetical protein